VDALFRDVHKLAQLYHWEEAGILRMSYARRHRYLRLIEQDEHAQLLSGIQVMD